MSAKMNVCVCYVACFGDKKYSFVVKRFNNAKRSDPIITESLLIFGAFIHSYCRKEKWAYQIKHDQIA